MSGIAGGRGYRVLDALSALCAVLTVVVLVLPATTNVTPSAFRVPVARRETNAQRIPAAAMDSVYRAIVRTNAFSASRKEPSVRFVAPGSEPTPPVPSAFDATAAGAPSQLDAEAGVRLFGIVSVDGAWRALLQVRSPTDAPRLLGVGESSGGVRVVRITGDGVVISTSSGRRTLRLTRVVPDSSENVP